MLDQDPWQFDKEEMKLTLWILKTSDIGALPYSLDQLHSVHLLAFKQNKENDSADMMSAAE